MKFDRSFWIALAILLVWFLLGWFLGVWLGIKPPMLTYLRVGLFLLGIAGFVGYLFLRPKPQDTPLNEGVRSAGQEIDYNFTEAAKRILAATGNKQLNSLPAIFLLGDSGSAKTTILTQSGVEPELLAGQAFQANAVVPTASVNLWFSRNTLFIDPSGNVVADAGARKKLFKKFLPVQLNSLLASKDPPTRSVLLTMDCDTFLQSGGAGAVAAKARDYQAILAELAHELGASFPVYVLFTKADKIPYFREFVENLTEAELAEMMGLSLPLPPSGLQGAYGEKQAQRLDNAFQTLYYSLADQRPAYLARERTAGNLSNIYEFPREFAKLRPLLVQFLTDLCRPSQLGVTSPFLRGFYFSGVRPVVINDVVPAAQVQQQDDAEFESGATRMFNRPLRSVPTVEARQAGIRRIPQWVFLKNLFPGVLLADRIGATAAQVNVKVNFVRRSAWAGAAALALIMAAWWTMSYLNNSRLIHGAAEDARAVPNAGLASGQLASTDALARLSRVRETLSTLNEYERQGAPLSYRAFLYKGSAIRQPLRETYYALFRRLLLQPTQQTLIEIAKNPGEDKQYSRYAYVYNALKAYLITTNNHDKRWNDFVPVLVRHWKKDQTVDAEREAQAAQNFTFYAEDLPDANPYPRFSVPDKDAVDTARVFLNGFPLEDSIYRALLDAAGEKLKSIVFNRDYPGTEDTIRNKYEIEPWFTKAAYANFQKRLQDPDANLGREEWVLGPATQQNIDLAKIRANLKLRYDNDFVKAWRSFMAATSENIPYGSYVRAAFVLEKLGGPQSALMQLFCVASENTNVASKEVEQAFQPVQFITPPGCKTQLVGQAANPYVAGLANLSNSLKAIGPETKPDLQAIGSAKSAVGNALSQESTLQLSLHPDPTDEKAIVLNHSESLLRDPINDVPPTFESLAGAPINQQAGKMCQEINPLFRKYPFSPTSKEDATVAEVNEVLNPQSGKLWAFVDSPAMKDVLVKSGNGYASAMGGQVTATGSFLNFVNRAAALRQMLYHGDSANPNLTFNIKSVASPDVDHVTLTINGSALSADPKSGTSQSFPWPGAAQDFDLEARLLGSTRDFPIERHRPGLWGVWHALERAEHDTGSTLQWTLATQGVGTTIVNGHPLTVKFSLDPATAQILRAQFFSLPACAGKAVQ